MISRLFIIKSNRPRDVKGRLYEVSWHFCSLVFLHLSCHVSSLDCPGVRVRGRGTVPRWREERRRGARGNGALQNRLSPWKQVVSGIRIRMFLGLQDPDPDPLVRVMDLAPAPGPSLFKNNARNKRFLTQNFSKKFGILKVTEQRSRNRIGIRIHYSEY